MWHCMKRPMNRWSSNPGEDTLSSFVNLENVVVVSGSKTQMPRVYVKFTKFPNTYYW
jgi:hypothetical protein